MVSRFQVGLVAFQEAAAGHKAILDGAALLLSLFCCARAYALQGRPAVAARWLGLLAGVLGLAMGFDDFLHAWDERYHAVVAKHLAQHWLLPTLFEDEVVPQAIDWAGGRIWVHKPPLALYLMAVSRRVLGPAELSLRLPSIALHCAAVLATARLGALFFSARAGLWAAFLVAVNGQLLDLAAGRQPTDHPESIFASLVCLSMLLAALHARDGRREHAVLAGALAGLAVLTKFLPSLVVFPCWAVWMRWDDRPRKRALDLALAVFVCAALSLPWTLFVRAAFPREAAVEAHHALLHLLQPLDGHAGSAFFHLGRIPRFFGEASPVALLAFFWMRRRLGSAGAGVALWFALPYLFFSLLPTKMENYPMLAAPAICLMIGAMIEQLVAQDLPVRSPRPAALLLLGLLVGLPARFLVERWKPFHRFESERAVSARLRALSGQLGPGKLAMFREPHPIEAMYYANAVAYPQSPTPDDEARARALGYRVVTLP